MPTPATRTPIKIARGSYSNLNSSIDDLQEGELVYATDQDSLYVKEGSSLISVSIGLLDEDNFASNSSTQAASQQSIKAYVDASSISVADDSLAEVKLDISNAPSDGYFLQYKDNTDQLTWAVPTDTNTQLTTEAVQDIVGAMFTGNTETNIAVTYEDSDGTIDLVADNDNTQLTTEQVQDIVGAMVDGGTETRIGVTYDDTSGKLNFVADDQSTDNNTTYTISCVDGDNSDEEKIRLTDSGAGTDDVVLEAGTGLSIARDGDKITFTNTVSDTNTQLTNEQVQDIVGGMFSGNTETNISATYQDSDGTIDLVATDTNTQLTTEAVQDIVGAMFSSNTETNISATYEDSDGTIDLVATNTTYSVVDSSANGLAPQLPGSHGGKFLKADGSWEVPPDTNTQIAIDDTPVDGVTNEAISSNWAYDHNAATGNSAHVPAAGSSGEFLAYNGAWATPADATKMPLAGGTFTGSVTFEDAINENVYALSGTELEPDNGMIQTKTLGGNTTLTESIAAGQSMLLMVDDGSAHTITWPTMTWVGGSAPTLATSGYTVIELWKVGGTLYGSHVGDVA